MAKIDGSKLLVNVAAKKRTHLVLTDEAGSFNDKTKVDKVKESMHGYSFQVKKPRPHNKKTLTVVIHSATRKEKEKLRDPASGMLVVTITTGTTTTDTTIPVVLIDDPDGCDEP